MTARAPRPAATAAATARLAYALLTARPPGGSRTWSRTNHRGEPITLLEGPAVAAGGVAGALAADASARDRLAVALAGAGAGAFGCYDDLAGNGGSRGFRGHLGALRKGELTTGAVKIAGIGATGLLAAIVAGPGTGPGGEPASAPAACADLVINAGLIAGGANLLNLFDLRPGRAIKVAVAAGGLLSLSRRGRAASAAPLAAAVALLEEDLAERSMLGDAGANALGAMLGTAAATSLSRPARAAALAVVVGLTAASEVVSFTRVIERTGPLRRIDMLGRRPAAAAVPGADADGGGPGPQAAADPGPGPHAAADPGPGPHAAADPGPGAAADPRPGDQSAGEAAAGKADVAGAAAGGAAADGLSGGDRKPKAQRSATAR